MPVLFCLLMILLSYTYALESECSLPAILSHWVSAGWGICSVSNHWGTSSWCNQAECAHVPLFLSLTWTCFADASLIHSKELLITAKPSHYYPKTIVKLDFTCTLHINTLAQLLFFQAFIGIQRVKDDNRTQAKIIIVTINKWIKLIIKKRGEKQKKRINSNRKYL